MRTTPAFHNNAIYQIAFGIALKQPIPSSFFDEVDVLHLIQSSLGEQFVEARQLSEMNFNVEAASVTSRIVGFEFESKIDDLLSKPVWIVRIIEDNVVVICNRFSSWGDIWGAAETYLKIVFSKLPEKVYEYKEVIFQCLDQFEAQLVDISEYSFEDVFDPNSDYFSKSVIRTGGLWHSHQGYFESLSQGKVALHNLKVNAKADLKDGAHITHIDHIVKVRNEVFDSSEVGDLFNSEFHYSISALMPSLYACNKEILRNLLSVVMQQETGLLKNE